MSGRRILIVEDNPTARKLYRLILQTEGYEVIEAGDAATALEALALHQPALVLQDLLLPDMRGVDLLQAMRALTSGREIPIVAVSGFRSVIDEAKVVPLGFDATLVKPVERVALLETVRDLLPPESSRPRPEGRGHRILVVDDDSVQRKLVRLRLVDAGFEVTSTSDGPSALALASGEPPSLILADVLMPEMDGFELCAAARLLPRLATVPVVLMSAHFVEQDDGALARQVGASGVVVRTPSLREVLDAVRVALEGTVPLPVPQAFPVAEHKSRLAHRLKHLAVLNASLVQRCAQQAAQLSIVGGVAEALARSENVDAVLQDVLAACLDAGGISKGALFREDARGVLSPEQSVGFDESGRATLASAFADAAVVSGLASGKPASLSVFLGSAELATFNAHASVTSSIFVPIMVEGRCHAALFLACGDGELNDEELLAFGRAIGAYVGQALALSSAFGRLHAAAEAGRILFSSLDVEKTLQALAEHVIKTMADLCEIDLVDAHERLRPEVIAHSDPAKVELVREMHRRYPPRPETSRRLLVLASGKSYLQSEMTDAERRELAEDDEHLAMLRAVGLRSHMVVPLLVQGRALGVMSVGTSRPGRRHGQADLALAEELAARAAIALENARLYKQAKDASRTKDEFLATVSHELRTPLNSVLGWTRVLRSGNLSADRAERALETIERNAVAQTQLVADILDVSAIVTGKLQLKESPVVLADVVTAALDSVRLSMDAKRIRCDVAIDPGIVLVCDPERMQQVAWNLFSNAIKFTPAGGQLAVTAAEADTHVELVVTDSGQGIPAHLLARVFDRFQQGDGSTTRVHGGLGLGLAISRHIVELHGGTIAASSEGAGAGSSFRVVLPRSPDAGRSPVAAGEPKPLPRAPAAAPATTRGASGLQGLRVLVVEDQEDARDLVVTILERCGAVPLAVSSAGEAMSQLAEATFDVLVSDIGMPHRDGMAFLRDVRGLAPERGGTIPALALSAYAHADEQKAALAAGYQMHLAKPFQAEDLVALLATLTGRGGAGAGGLCD